MVVVDDHHMVEKDVVKHVGGVVNGKSSSSSDVLKTISCLCSGASSPRSKLAAITLVVQLAPVGTHDIISKAIFSSPHDH